MFQQVNSNRPVAQKPSRPAGSESWPMAIAVVSSMTKWAATSRRRPGTRSNEARRRP